MKGQNVGEYVLVVSIVIAFVMVMFPMVKRGTQSIIKVTADQIGNQKNAEQDFSAATGYTVNVSSAAHSYGQSTRMELPGAIETGVADTTDSTSESVTNEGFSTE